MNEKDFQTVENMRKYGGGFVQLLALLAYRADPQNLRKIKKTWPEYWKAYEKWDIKKEDEKGN